MEKKKNEDKVKTNKSLMIGLISVMIIILAALLVYIVATKINSYKDNKKLMEEFREYVNNDEISLVYYMHTGCQFCAMEEPILERIAEDYDFNYLTVDSSKLSGSDKNEVLNKLGIEGKTPTLVIVKSGRVTAVNIGYLDGHKLVEFLVEAEFLDEGSTYKPEENLTFIEYEEFEKLRDSDDEYVLTIGTSTCEYCREARPTLSNVAKAYNIPIYYVSLDYFSKDDRNEFFDDLESLKYDETGFVNNGTLRTPSVLVIKNGRVTDHLEGIQDITSYVKFFKEQKIIKES